MRKAFTKILAVMLVCLFAISGFNFSIVADNSSTASPLGETFSAANIEVRGKITLLLYFKNVDNVEYFKVKIPQADGSTATTKIDKSDLVYNQSNDRYTLKVPLAAAQQADDISFQAFDANGNAGKPRSYSVKKYADQLFDLATQNPTNEKYAAAAKAVESMLNYGAMAQTYFGHSTNNMANTGLYYRGTNPIKDMGYEDIYGITSEAVPSYKGADIRFTNVNAYLEDTLSLRFYFEYTGTTLNSPEELTVTIEGKTYKYDQKSKDNAEIFQDELGKYYVLVNNIPSTCFNTQYTVELSDGSGSNSASIKYSVFNYLQARFEQDYSQEFADVFYSMFQFYAWTSEYVGTNVVPESATCSHDRTYIQSSTYTAVCSDCGKGLQATATVGTFNLDGSGNVTTVGGLTGGLSYQVSGGTFNANTEFGFVGIKKSEKMTITLSEADNTSSTKTNRLHLHYYASAPVKVTMNYSYGANREKTASEYYYLEAGENFFSALEWSFLASKGNGAEWDKVTYYGENQNFKLANITVESLTDSVDFVLFDYKTETADTSKISSTTYGGNVTCYLLYLSSSRYKLGVNLTWGGSISELYDLTANSGSINGGTNLVNRSDAGRLIQQSYYGTTGNGDGYTTHYWRSDEKLAYAEWNYNPVQGGDANNSQSRIIDFEVGSDYIYIKAQPRDWANHVSNGDGTYTKTDSRYTECYMENRYTMMNGGTTNTTADDYIQVDNRMVDYSGYNHPRTTQELPAFYTLAYFDDYYWYSGTQPWEGALTQQDNLPFWGDPAYISQTTFNYQTSNTETWAAFVNGTTKYGLGMYVPNTDVFKGGRVNGSEANKSYDAASGYASYFAPLKELQIVCYEPIEYSYLLCAGNIDSIRSVFKANKDFASNASLDNNSISQKLPEVQSMASIDFSKEENLVFLDSVTDATLSYDADKGAAKFVVTGNDSYFWIDYTTCQDFTNTTYNTANYSCIEFEYMVPADSVKYPSRFAVGQVLFYQVGDRVSPDGNYAVGEFVTLIADGKWHTARYYTSNIGANWTGNINSLRIDFLNNPNLSEQVFYLKSFSITNDTAGSAVTTLGGVGFSGQALIDQMTDRHWDQSGAATFSMHDGDYVTAVVGSVDDRYVGFNLGGTTETGKYMVIKYRTDAIPTDVRCAILAAAGSDTINTVINTSGVTACQGSAYGWVGDGKWHTLVVDLSAVSANVAAAGDSVALSEVRIDLLDCFAPGTVIDIAYVGFCNDISKAQATLEDGELLEYAAGKWSLSVDAVQMDGVAATKNSAELEIGAAQTSAPIIQGSVWDFAGWFAIDGSDVTSVEYCITEEDGTENWISAKKNGGGVCRYFAAEQGVIDNINGRGYSASTVPYRLALQADLRNYIGQTVTVSIRAITTDGRAVILYYVKVKVILPEYSSLDYVLATDELYKEMFGGSNDSIGTLTQNNPEVIKNADGTVSVTVTEKTANNITMKWIGIQPDKNIATGNYMVIRYRTSATPANREFYLYVASDGKKVESEDNRMTSFGLIGDGNWHTLVIDLSVANAVNVSGDYKYHISDIRFQMLDQFATGSVIDFEYIGFCNSIKDVPVNEGETIEHGWNEWVTNIDTAYMNGNISDTNYTDGTEAAYNSANANIGPDQSTILEGSTWAINGWFGFNGRSVEELSISITNVNGVEEYEAAIEPTTASVPVRWYSTDEITDHLTGSEKYSYGTVGYRFNISQDLSAFAGQTVTLSVKVLTSEGLEVVIYRVKITVPGTFAPKNWSSSIDTFLYDRDGDFAAIEGTISGAYTNSSSGTTLANSSGTYPEIDASYVCWSAGWLAINGHDISNVTYTVYDANGNTLTSGDVPLMPAEEGVVSHVTNNLGYVGSTPYRINAGVAPVIDLNSYLGQTVTVVFSVTVPNTANPVEIIRINVTVSNS